MSDGNGMNNRSDESGDGVATYRARIQQGVVLGDGAGAGAISQVRVGVGVGISVEDNDYNGKADNSLQTDLQVRSPVETIQAAVWAILEALDLDTHSEHFQDTPRRVAEALLEFRQPTSLLKILKAGFSNQTRGDTSAMIVQTKIPFKAMCPHHLMPLFGEASIGYIPRGKIVGLSKLTRLVGAAGIQHPATQEDITNIVADTLVEGLDPTGVMVITEAIHMCMSARGVNAPNVVTKVSALRGAYLTVEAARTEFLTLIR